MSETALVTGGAGFIGSHLVDALLVRGFNVRVVDCLLPQVHPTVRPKYLRSDVEYVFGPLEDPAIAYRAVRGVDVVFHQAARVGVGQSMFRILDFVEGNSLSTATLLSAMVESNSMPRRLLVASSMAVYGEGAYFCEECGVVRPSPRSELRHGGSGFEQSCPIHGSILVPVPISESMAALPNSVYGLTKLDQEVLCLTFGRAYGVPTLAMRYFGVYGPRQTVSNPYSGVVAMFAGQLSNGRPPLIFEDGQQMRDYVHVLDVVDANMRALDHSDLSDRVFNVASGRPVRIIDIARMLARELKADSPINVTQKMRSGDIRHCYGDTDQIQTTLGFSPKITLEKGIAEYAHTLNGVAHDDEVQRMFQELLDRRLLH